MIVAVSYDRTSGVTGLCEGSTMLKLSISDLNDRALHNFVKEVSVTNQEFNLHVDSINDEGDNNRYESWAAGYCTLADDEVSIEFSWGANGGQDTYELAHEFEISPDPDNSDYTLTGFILVDDNGEEITGWERHLALYEFLKGGEWEQHVRRELPYPETENIEMESNMEEFTVRRDSDRDIKFKGDKVASAASSANQAMGSSYSGSTGRWKELALYKTAGGKYICEKIERTQWQGERDRFHGAVCETIDQVIEFFGTGWLAKELYYNAGIDSSINVD